MQMVTLLGASLFCFLKIGLQWFEAFQQALKGREKQRLDLQCVYHAALKKMLKHFPKAVTPEIKIYAICLCIED